MNAQKLTQKSLEAVQAAQDLAVSGGHIQIEPLQLLSALLSQQEGLIPSLLQKMGKDPRALSARVNTRLDGMPRVSGPGREPDKVYISAATDAVLSGAEKLAANMKDEYVSVEHLFLSLIDNGDRDTAAVLSEAGIN